MKIIILTFATSSTFLTVIHIFSYAQFVKIYLLIYIYNVFSFVKYLTAPKVFEIVEDAIRPFQSDATKAAYNLFSHNKDEWQKVLLADINPEQLPIRFGGTKILKNRHGVVIN